MDKLQEQYFQALSQDRAESATLFDKPSMRGIKTSVVEKYSDQAHFIYELLQNADDAGATTARFVLEQKRLIFAHNGVRRFSVSNPDTEDDDTIAGRLGDINAITSIANSNKTTASIGKFGVGFKAVFQYTATPHIYDPDIFFRIERFIVPVRISEDYPGRHSGETMFVFPFDHDKRSSEEAYADISEKLRSLDYPLLFLSNLKDIEFEISGVLGLYGKTIEEKRIFDRTTAEFIRLTQNDGEDREELYDNTLWLFTRDDGNNHKYSVGFFINKKGHLLPKTHRAFCFFPTKEVTGLNFIIHAPFLLTDSREGIRAGVQHNLDMVSLLATLAADSLVYLRDIGLSQKIQLIDDNIFDIVPYDETAFGDVASKKSISFKPFYTAIKEAFEKKEIIPSTNDSYVFASNAYWGGNGNNQLAEVFSNSQLAALTHNEEAKWAFPSLSTPRSAGKSMKFDYIQSIIQKPITDNAVIESLEEPFIEKQKIEWLHTLYKYISTNNDRTMRAKYKPIFVDVTGKAVPAYNKNNHLILFLPTDSESGYTTINAELLSNEETVKFIERLGISTPSLKDEILNRILPKYKDDNASINTRTDFKKFFHYYQECPRSEAKDFIESLKETAFVLYQSNSDKTQYGGKAEELYFPSESLIQWFESKPDTKFVSFDEYLEIVGKGKKEELEDFLNALGVKAVPRILTYEPILRASTHTKHRDEKWTEIYFDGCKEILDVIASKKDTNKSVFLWAQLISFLKSGHFSISSSSPHNSVLFCIYEYFYYKKQSELLESEEAKRLRGIPWLMNAEGDFLPASKLTRQSISPVYDTSSDEAAKLFKLLGIEGEIPEDVDLTSFGDQLGLSREEQRQALLEYAKKKKIEEGEDDFDSDEKDGDEPNGFDKNDIPVINPSSIKRVGKEITKRATSTRKAQPKKDDVTPDDVSSDEDDYSKPGINIDKKIEKVKEQADHAIQKIAHLEDLRQKAQEAEKYSFGWFKSLLELEIIESGESNSNSKEISISFAKVEREQDSPRTLILKHPNRYIPQFIEDLADIPLVLHYGGQKKNVAIEVVNVKSYTLRVKMKTGAEIDGIDLSMVTEARIDAKNPVFLLEELWNQFIKLGRTNEQDSYADDFNMRDNLCKNIEFVFGPPGTGKTTYLAQKILMPLMQAKENIKVLVLTPTNKAADVLVSRIMEVMGQDRSYLNWLVRFGATNSSDIEDSGVFREKIFDIRKFVRNVTVTTIARFPYDYFMPTDDEQGEIRLHLHELKWDYIVVDEASMIPLVNIIYPLYKKTPSKFIIAGDPFQIEPITSIDLWKNENIYTLVKLNSFTAPHTEPYDYHVELLTKQYRSIPQIGEVFSRFAYGGVLTHNRSAESKKALGIETFIDVKSHNIIKFPVSKYESIYRPKRLQGRSNYQIYSALFAFEFSKYLAKLLERANNNPIFKIGIIAPYRAQSDLIDKLIAKASIPDGIDIQVGTIHGFQGDECDIIIAVFNPPPFISSSKEMFLNKLNIINVSVSRARDYLFVIMPDDETENVENLKLIKSIEKLCHEQNDCAEFSAQEIESLMFDGNESYLEENSFSTSHQLVNVYGEPERKYEIRSEDSAVDVQVHELKSGNSKNL